MKKNAITFSKNTTYYTWEYQNLRTKIDLYNKENFKPDLSNALAKPLAAISLVFPRLLTGGLRFKFLWDLIYLRKFGYRNKFIHMIQVASINIQSKMKINGLLSDSFTPIQGFHQVCPLSMLLWIIVAKVLAIFIDANTRIEDTQIGDHQIKKVNFAY